MKTILVTGGCGFIGSNFLNLFVPLHPDVRFVNVDKLTYAGNPHNLEGIAKAKNYAFERADICDQGRMRAIFEQYDPAWVIHFAAESHVDRSIHGPREFLETNVMGTFTLLECCRAAWKSPEGRVFEHVSTDEVHGALGPTGYFSEATPYDPSSPYSASKAASDHIVRAYFRTYGLPVKVTNCSNNYGPLQFPEKLIPLMILNAKEGKKLPVYGTGMNVRDWLYVDDHCRAIWRVAEAGKVGDTYHIGGSCEKTNLDIVHGICDLVATETGKDPAAVRGLITYVTDRPGHDFRYAIDASKITGELGWRPEESFETGLRRTVQWYLSHPEWVAKVRSGEYRKWMELNYGERSAT